MHDVVIRGGRIVDGTGRPAVPGDVAIDAAGQVVPPGFVDVHTHLDALIVCDGEHTGVRAGCVLPHR